MGVLDLVKTALTGESTTNLTNPIGESHRNFIYNTKWGNASTFHFTHFQLINNNKKYSDKCIFLNTNSHNSLPFLNTAIVSLSTPNITSQPIEEWVGGKWLFTNGRQELRQLEITFRDVGDSMIWKNFAYLYDELKNAYPDDAKWRIALKASSLESVVRLDDEGHSGATIIDTSEAILTNIGSIQYSKDNGDII